MTFIPTKEELEELGFMGKSPFWFYWNIMVHLDTFIEYDFKKNKFYFDSDVEIYPQSLEDIKTLIKLLTPPHP